MRVSSSFQNIFKKMQKLGGEPPRRSPKAGAACLESRKARSGWAGLRGGMGTGGGEVRQIMEHTARRAYGEGWPI